MNSQNAQLLAAIQNKDGEAFSRIIDRSVGQRAFVYAVSLFEDRTQAENVAQSAVDKALICITEGKMLSLDSPIAYMQKIVRNHIFNESERRKERFLSLTDKERQQLAWVDEEFAKFDKEEDVEPHPWRVFRAKDVGADAFKNLSPLKDPRLRYLLESGSWLQQPEGRAYKIQQAFYRSLKAVYNFPSRNGPQMFSLYLKGYRQSEIAEIMGKAKSTISEAINDWQNWMGWHSSHIDMFRMSWLVATLVRLYIINKVKIERRWDEELGCEYHGIRTKIQRGSDRFGMLAVQHFDLRAQLQNLNEDEQDFYLVQVPENYFTVLLDPPMNWRQILPTFKAWAGTDYEKLDRVTPTDSWSTYWKSRSAYNKKVYAQTIRQDKTDEQNWKWWAIDYIRNLPKGKRALYIDAWRGQEPSRKNRNFLDELKQTFVVQGRFYE